LLLSQVQGAMTAAPFSPATFSGKAKMQELQGWNQGATRGTTVQKHWVHGSSKVQLQALCDPSQWRTLVELQVLFRTGAAM